LSGRQLNNRLNMYGAVTFTYKTIGLKALPAHYLKPNELRVLADVLGEGHMVLQTCNRVELYLHGSPEQRISKALSLLREIHSRDVTKEATVMLGAEAVQHLFEVSSGVDSLAVGEYDVLRQVRQSLADSESLGVADYGVMLLGERALRVGRKVRVETMISRGKVGVYSLAVDYAIKRLGDLRGLKVAVVGAGNMGSKVASILRNQRVSDLTVFSRTLERAKDLASKLGASWSTIDKIDRGYDLVFAAVANPSDGPSLVLPEAKLIVDLSVPPMFSGENVVTMDDLREVSREAAIQREGEVVKAKEIIANEVNDFALQYLNYRSKNYVAKIMWRVEEVRRRELERAVKELAKLGEVTPEMRQVLEDMSNSIARKSMQPVFEKISALLREGQENYINFLVDTLVNGDVSHSQTEKVKEE